HHRSAARIRRPCRGVKIGDSSVRLRGVRVGAPRRPRCVRYAVMLKGIIADELRNERGLVRALLTLQARWERANVHLADRVIVPSRYSAGVAHEVYGAPRERI